MGTIDAGPGYRVALMLEQMAAMAEGLCGPPRPIVVHVVGRFGSSSTPRGGVLSSPFAIGIMIGIQ